VLAAVSIWVRDTGDSFPLLQALAIGSVFVAVPQDGTTEWTRVAYQFTGAIFVHHGRVVETLLRSGWIVPTGADITLLRAKRCSN
jgi:hypothetical protein